MSVACGHWKAGDSGRGRRPGRGVWTGETGERRWKR